MFYQLSAIPNVGMVVICFVVPMAGIEPADLYTVPFCLQAPTKVGLCVEVLTLRRDQHGMGVKTPTGLDATCVY